MKRRMFWLTAAIGFLGINLIAYNHAYKFTHFSSTADDRTRDPSELSSVARVGILLTGISNPRPKNVVTPDEPYQTVTINSDVSLEAWLIEVPQSHGTVILFHGYTGTKSQLLERAKLFRQAGNTTLLVDFMGSGGSGGSETHLGYTESVEVRDCVRYMQTRGERNIHVFGTSMGAAAILKACRDYQLSPASLILECPFGSLYETVSARFGMMGVPSFPMAAILTFWGGVQLDFWGFGHNPADYAAQVTAPALILFGERDNRVSKEEIMDIYNNISGKKKLVTYRDFGHDVFNGNEENWQNDVNDFMSDITRLQPR